MARKTQLASRFLTIFNRLVAVKPHTKVLLALSGGLDSIVLFDLMRRHSIKFEVAHCNFKLRGRESDKESRLAIEICKKYDIPVHINYFETEFYANENGISIEMAARELRYNWFEELMTAFGFGFLATAHHAGDSFETALLNLSKGTGITGLKGISPINGNVIRPLLGFTKMDLKAYADLHKLIWREDESNNSNEFQRNLLRNKVLPLLKNINPSLETTFYHSSWRIALWVELLKDKIQEFDKKHKVQENWEIPKEVFTDTEQRAVFVEFLSDKGFDIATVRNFIEKQHLKIGTYFTSTSMELLIERDYFLLRKIENFNPIHLEISCNGDFELPIGGILSIKNFVGKVIFTDPNCVFFAKNDLQFPLLLRTWAIGDRIQPFGMKGTKLVSDILIDKKVPNNKKNQVLVLLSGGEIMWVLGLKTSEKYRISVEERSVIQVKFKI